MHFLTTKRLRRTQLARTLGLAVAFLATSVAIAIAGDAEPYHLTKAGEAAAHASVLTRADLGISTAAWKLHLTEPKSSPASNCGSFNPKQSDLVVTGDVDADYSQPGLDFDSEAQILKTSKMLHLDWKRTIQTPGLVKCIRDYATKNSTASKRFISFSPRAFAHPTPRIAAYRMLYDIHQPSGSTTRTMTDFVFIARGRAEISLVTTCPLAAAQSVQAAELRLARILTTRAAHT